MQVLFVALSLFMLAPWSLRRFALIGVSLLFTMGCVAATVPPANEPQTISMRPAHHTDTGFQNPHPIDTLQHGFWAFWRMRLFGEPFPDYRLVAAQVPVVALEPQRLVLPAGSPRLTWIGHASFLLQYRGLNLLTDPHLSARASPLSFAGPERLVALPISVAELPPIDYVVISHSHYDHLDRSTVDALGDRPLWLVPLGVKAILVGWGIDPTRVIERDWWQSYQQDGIRFTATPAHHFSARTLWDRNQTLWASWMVELEGFNLWFAGDTAYEPRLFQQIKAQFPNIDLALIPIGAYGPRWFMREHHVNPEEALLIHQQLGAQRSIGMHWGTFQLTSEPMLEPPLRLTAAVDAAGPGLAPFDTMAIGEVRELPTPFRPLAAP